MKFLATLLLLVGVVSVEAGNPTLNFSANTNQINDGFDDTYPMTSFGFVNSKWAALILAGGGGSSSNANYATTAGTATNAPNGTALNGLSLLVQNQTVYGQNTADGNGVLTNTTICFLTSPWSNLTNGVFTAFFTNTVSLSPIVWFSNPQDPTNFVAYDKNTVLVGTPILLDTTTNDSTGATAFALASNPMTIWYDSNIDPLPGLFSYVNVSYFELSVTTPLIVTNTQPGSGNSSQGTILGVADSYYTNSMIWGETLFVSPGQYWSGNMDSYAGYFSNFNSTVAAYSGSPLGKYGLCHYIWNHYIGSTRASVGVENAFGTNGYFGDIIEFLPLKAQEANIASGLFAHPIRLDGYGRVQVGNIPEANHGRFYPAAGFLDVVAGTNTDTPAMILSSETLTLTTFPGAIERSGGKLYFTDDSSNRAAVFTGSNGNGLTNISLAALPSGVVTNYSIVSVYITNAASLYVDAVRADLYGGRLGLFDNSGGGIGLNSGGKQMLYNSAGFSIPVPVQVVGAGTFSGTITVTNGYASYATNQIVTSSSTTISNGQSINMTVFITAATALCLTNGLQLPVFIGQTVAAFTPFTLQPHGHLDGVAITCVGTNAW